MSETNFSFVVVVVAQLAKQSLPIPQVRGSNTVISDILKIINLMSTVLRRRK